MCIAVIKPKGAAFPSTETLKRCFDSNSDGAGIAWQDGDIIRWVKGLMTFDAFKTKLDSLGLTSDNLVFLHFRIGTHGGKTNPNMTHPFPILKDKDELLKLEGTCKHIAMHNGVISSYGTYVTTDPRSQYSDTVNFTAEWVADCVSSDLFFLDEQFEKDLGKESNSAKYAIMGCGQYKKFGYGWIEEAGCFYSNNGFRPFASTYSSRGTTGGSCGGGYGYNSNFYSQKRNGSGEAWTRYLRVLGPDEAFVSGSPGSKTPVVYIGSDFADTLLVNEFDEVYQNLPSKKKKTRWICVGNLIEDWELENAFEREASDVSE